MNINLNPTDRQCWIWQEGVGFTALTEMAHHSWMTYKNSIGGNDPVIRQLRTDDL